jgi:hypothetical protein
VWGTVEAERGNKAVNLLHMLLEGNPPISALSEALPIAVATRDTLLRRRLSQMLLRKGADVISSGGESILQATQLLDMVLLDMLLERRPHVPSLSRAFAAALSHSDSNVGVVVGGPVEMDSRMRVGNEEEVVRAFTVLVVLESDPGDGV